MESDVPKPFIKLHQKTILEHTVNAFKQVKQVSRIVIAVSGDSLQHVTSMFTEQTEPEILCIEGGSERQHSVYNALHYAGDADLVAVHDAVRPFVTGADILACCEAALNTGAALLAVKAADTVKIVGKTGLVVSTADRDTVWLAQTPQIFKRPVLEKAFQQAGSSGKMFTDDASLVEDAGFPVRVVPGDPRNFKLTYPRDMERAKYMMERPWQN